MEPYSFQKSRELCCTTQGGPDCVPRINEDAHPATHATDGSLDTYWQSEEGISSVNLTVDLGNEQEVYEIAVHFAGNVAAAVAIERSLDGTTFTPMQYFARDCNAAFGMVANSPITRPDQVICDTTQVSVTQTALTLSTVLPRLQSAGGDFARSDVLQQYIRARYLRLRFQEYFTEETAVDFLGRTVQTFPLYRVAEFAVESRCSCNGHSSRCAVDPISNEGPEQCVCAHDTAGDTCDTCKPLFNAKPFRRGMAADEPNVCVECDCNSHATRCHYDAAFDAYPDDRSRGGGGVCECLDNTAGQHCDTCAPGFFQNPGAPRDSLDACIPCACEARGTASPDSCDAETGECECKPAVEGPRCDTCRDGFFGLAADSSDGCAACACNLYGTEDSSQVCHKSTGQCACRPSATGRACDRCSEDYFPAPGGAPGQCTACHAECMGGCRGFGASTAVCVKCRNFEENGQCVSACSAFRYPDQNGVCQECPDQCAGGCATGNPTTESCSSCKNFALDGVCVPACSASTYPDSAHVCQACHPECAGGCSGPGADQCNACKHASNEGTCVSKCPVHRFRDASGFCKDCSPACNLLHGCSGPGSFDCEVCDQYTDLSLVTRDFDCVSFCPRLAYETETVVDGRPDESPVCLACFPECAEGCDGPTGKDCQGACAHFSLGSECVPSCPVHTYPDGKRCVACSATCNAVAGCDGPGPADCVECASTAFTLGRQCLAECPDGYYGDELKRCLPCDENCVRCTGPAPNECTSCRQFVFGSTCVDACPPALSFVAGGPPTQAPEVSSGDDSGRSGDGDPDLPTLEPTASPKVPDDDRVLSPYRCQLCHPQCSGGCTGPTARQCTRCAFVEDRGTCVARCPATTYELDGKCMACHKQCAGGCSGPAATECDACLGLKTGDRCVAKCPIEEYGNAAGTNCEPCHPECSSVLRGCSGSGADQCRRCKNFENEIDGSCVPACPFGTYRDQSVCKACHPECDGCKGPAPEQCDACRTYSHDGTCVEECPEGTYPDASGTCLPCDPQCAYDCAGPRADDCVPRTPGDSPCKAAQDGALCVPFCNSQRQYKDGFVCRSCAVECGNEGCTGPSKRDCNACPRVSVDDACASECPNDRYLSGATCLPCSPQCVSDGEPKGTGQPFCSGPSDLECTRCKVAKRNSRCISGCEASEFVGEDQTCTACDAQCKAPFGCNGPASDQCKVCANYRVGATCVATCPPDSMYATPGEALCRPCHPECSTGVGDGCPGGGSVNDCKRCRHVRQNGVCVGACNTNHYPDNSDTTSALGGECKPCSSECDPQAGCRGARADQCVKCATFDYLGTCLQKCPPLTFVNGKKCEVCDPNCLFGCTGAGADQCTREQNSLDQTARGLGCVHTATITSVAVVCKPACDVGTYKDPDGVCRPCHSLCSAEYGCTGRLRTDCVPCPETAYSFISDRQQCAACDSACAAGCSGPGDTGCDACKGGRMSDGHCISSCAALNDVDAGRYFYTDASGSEPVCLECHPFCAPGGCTGGGPQECSNGCKAFTSFATFEEGMCVDKCGQNSFQTDIPVAQTCAPCSPLCSGGCRDASPASCVRCARVKAKGVCMEQCPSNEVPDSDGNCQCPSASGYVDANGACKLCSLQCANGCFGPSPNQCLPRNNGDSGCRNVQMGDTCTARCDDGMTAGLDRVCSFSCHEQCGGLPGECFGVGPHQCKVCKAVSYRNVAKNRNECAAACPSLQTADERNVCQPCHSQCQFACSVPEDPASCIGGCKKYHDQGICVNDCPLKRPFAAGVGGKVCLEQCPVGRVFYNDTRSTDGSGFTMPQLCVASCDELAGGRTASDSEEFPNRCVTVAQAQADLAAASAGVLSSTSLAAIIVGCIAFVLLIAALVAVSYRRRSASVDIRNEYGVSNYSAKSPSHGGLPAGGMSPSRASRDSYTFDPDNSVQNAEYFDASVLGAGQSSGRNLYPMGNNALFADYAEPPRAAGSGEEYQTTHM